MGSGLTYLTLGSFALTSISLLLAILSSYIISNNLSKNFHDGIFYRCGALQNLNTAWEHIKSLYGSKQLEFYSNDLNTKKYLNDFYKLFSEKTSEVKWFADMPGNCYWWNKNVFTSDEHSLRAAAIFSFISCGALTLAILIFSFSCFERLKTRRVFMITGSFLLLNALSISGVIIAYYIFMNNKSYRDSSKLPTFETPKQISISLSPLRYAWSFWCLFAAAGCSLLTAILTCCTPVSTKRYYDEVYSGYLK